MSVLALALSSLACAGLPPSSGAAPVPSGAPFPTGPVAARCGTAAPAYAAAPEASLGRRFAVLGSLSEEGVRARLCATDVRQEVAVALTVLGTRWGDVEALRDAAEVYFEPVALSASAAAHASGTAAGGPVPEGARRARLAAARIAARIGERTHRDDLAERVAEVAGALTVEEAGRESLGADPSAASARRAAIDAIVAGYEALYLVEARS